MHYLYRYVCILNGFFYMCIWTIVCNKEFIIIIIDTYKAMVVENSDDEWTDESDDDICMV